MSEPGRSENEAIARRAYEIWEAEGRPHGRDREHWEAAAKELGSPAPMPSGYTDAEVLGTRVGTVKSRVSRARSRLDGLLSGREGFDRTEDAVARSAARLRQALSA